jgi:site-specific DNA recombinase
MIDDAMNGKIDLILTKSISRFGRNIVDILTTLRSLSNLEPPVAVSFESEGIFSSDEREQFINIIHNKNELGDFQAEKE